MEETAQDTLPLPFLGAARHPRHLFRQEVAHGMKRLVLVAFVTVECLHVHTRAPHILGHDTDQQGLAYAPFSPYPTVRAPRRARVCVSVYISLFAVSLNKKN